MGIPLIIVIVGGLSFYFKDLSSDPVFFAVFLPICDFLLVVALAVWLVFFFHRRGISQNAATSGSGAGGRFWGGFGDGGGGDGSC